MKLPRLPRRRRWRVVLGILVLPPVLWAFILAVVPTDHSRRCIAERLSAASGRVVSVGGLRVGVFGGVSLRDVRIGAPRSGDDPWLKVGRASINISLAQLLFGQIEPTRIEVGGLDLRVLRRRDGTLELSDFLEPQKSHSPGTDDGNSEAAGLDVVITRSRVIVVDEPTGTHLEFAGVEGHATCRGSVATVTDLRGTLNGGSFQFVGELDRSKPEPVFEGHFLAENVALKEGMKALAYLVPVIGGTGAKLDGRLGLEMYLSGKGKDRQTLRQTLQGQGRVELDPVLLDHSRLLAEFGPVLDLPPEGRVGSVHANVAIRNGRVITDQMTIDVGRVPVSLSGWTDFDGRIEYRLRSDTLTDRLPTRARQYLNELEINLNDFAEVRVTGTVDDLVLRVNGQGLNGGGEGDRIDPKERLKEIGRRIQDRIRR